MEGRAGTLEALAEVEHFERSITNDPENLYLWRRLLAASLRVNDDVRTQQLLDRWMAEGRGTFRLEAITSYVSYLITKPQDARIFNWKVLRLRLHRFILRRYLLFRIPRKNLEARVRVHMAVSDSRGLIEELESAPRDKTRALPPPDVERVAEIVSASGLHLEFLRAFGSDMEALSEVPVALTFIADAAERTGDFELAKEARKAVDDSHSMQLLDAEQAEEWLQAEQLLSRWAGVIPVGGQRLQQAIKVLKYRKNEELLRQIIDHAIQGRLLSPADYRIAAENLIAADEDEEAFRIARAGLREYPDNIELLDIASFLGDRVREQEFAQMTRTRRLLLQEVDRGLLDAIGAEELSIAGGRYFLHSSLLSALSDNASVDGLISVVELCLMSLRRLVALRSGQRREAKELAKLGAANWQACVHQADRLAGVIDVLSGLILRKCPDCKRTPEILLELRELYPSVQTLAASLCRLMLENNKDLSTRVGNLVWRVALDHDDPDLRTELQQHPMMPSKDALFYRFVEAEAEIRNLSSHEVRAEPEVHHKRISVLSSDFDRNINLSIRTQRDMRFSTQNAIIHAGYLVELKEERILQILGGWSIIARIHPVSQYGLSGILLEQTEDIEIVEPLLFVPGIRVQYDNYFHFVGQIFPRIVSVWNEYEGLDLVVGIPDFSPNFIKELLVAGGIPSGRIVELPSDRSVRVNQLVSTSPTTHDWQCSPADLEFARSCLRISKEGERRVFLSRLSSSVRSRNRSLVNEADLLEVATRKGFEVVDSGSLGIEEQRDLFAQCSVVCGPTGAALANTLLLPERARVVCLSPRETCRTYYPGLTLGSRVSFAWVLGSFDSTAVASVRFPHLPYTVPSDLLEKAL